MSSIRTKGIGPLVLAVVLIAASLVFAPMGYYYNIAGGVVINKAYAQEDGEEEEVVEVTTDEEEEPTTTTAGDEVVVEEQPITTEEQPPITATTEEDGQQPLSALFFIDSTNGDAVPATFLFEADPEGGTEPYTYSWDFGDGSQQGSGESLTHTYQNPGTYTVTLTVTDSAGQTATDTQQVTVEPPSPLTSVEIIPNSTQGVAPATFEFAADIFREETRGYTFSWDFGDGQTATGEIVTHTFQNPGTYVVRVLVIDSTTGQTVTDTEQVIVQPSTTTEGQQPPTPANATTTLQPTNNQTTSNATIVAEESSQQQQALATPSTTTTIITISDDANGGDCRDIGGNWNPNRKQCVLRSDINGRIVIASNDITLNCANRTITEEGGGDRGILLSDVSGVTVRNCRVSGFGFGIFLFEGATNNLIVGNTVTDNGNGISAQRDTDNNIIRGNTASNNRASGIFILLADNNIIENNRANDNGLQGIRLRASADNVVMFNTARGNIEDGFAVIGFPTTSTTTNNEFAENESRNNGGYGFLDGTEDSGTAGTANTYTNNICSGNDSGGSSPTGLCSPQP